MKKYILLLLIVVYNSTILFAMSAEDKAFFAEMARQKEARKAKAKAAKEKRLKLNAKRVSDATKKSSRVVIDTDVDMSKREAKIKNIMDAAAYLEKRLEAKKRLLAARNRVKVLNALLKSADYNRYKINTSQIDNIFSLGDRQKIVLSGNKLNTILEYVVSDFSKKQAEKKGFGSSSIDDFSSTNKKNKKSKKKSSSSSFTASKGMGYEPTKQIVLTNGDFITYNSDYIINFVRVENSYAIFKIASK